MEASATNGAPHCVLELRVEGSEAYVREVMSRLGTVQPTVESRPLMPGKPAVEHPDKIEPDTAEAKGLEPPKPKWEYVCEKNEEKHKFYHRMAHYKDAHRGRGVEAIMLIMYYHLAHAKPVMTLDEILAEFPRFQAQPPKSRDSASQMVGVTMCRKGGLLNRAAPGVFELTKKGRLMVERGTYSPG